MRIENAVVEAIDTKAVNTRFGSKTTYSFKVDGQWYRTNFKAHGLSVGDSASFDAKAGTYGNEVDPATIKKGAATVAAPAPATVTALPKATPTYGGKGAFPIPALDGQRSIVRQNALTNARELVAAAVFAKGGTLDVESHPALIITIARKFEAYACGDDAMEMAAAAVAEEQKKAA